MRVLPGSSQKQTACLYHHLALLNRRIANKRAGLKGSAFLPVRPLSGPFFRLAFDIFCHFPQTEKFSQKHKNFSNCQGEIPPAFVLGAVNG